MPQAIQFKIVPERNSAKEKRATTQTTSSTQPIAQNTKWPAEEQCMLLLRCQKTMQNETTTKVTKVGAIEITPAGDGTQL